MLCTAENEEGVRAFLADAGWQDLQVEDETPARRAGFMLEIVRKGRTP